MILWPGTHIIEGTWKNSSQCGYSYVGGWRFQFNTWQVCNLKFSKLPSLLLVHKLRNAIWPINLWISWQCPTFPLGNRTCGCCTSWLASWPTEYFASSEQTMSFLTFGECSCQVWPYFLHKIMMNHFCLYSLLRCCVILCEHNLNCQSFCVLVLEMIIYIWLLGSVFLIFLQQFWIRTRLLTTVACIYRSVLMLHLGGSMGLAPQ